MHLDLTCFSGSGFYVVPGHPFLSGVIGEPENCEMMIHWKIDNWIHSVINAFPKAAKRSPQAALLQWLNRSSLNGLIYELMKIVVLYCNHFGMLLSFLFSGFV